MGRLNEDCTKNVSKLLSKTIPSKSIGNLRRIIKAGLQNEINELDGIVKRVFK
jgi:hypothetical protein